MYPLSLISFGDMLEAKVDLTAFHEVVDNPLYSLVFTARLFEVLTLLVAILLLILLYLLLLSYIVFGICLLYVLKGT